MPTKHIETSRFGPIDVEEDRILKFVAPILGFERHKDYVLLDHMENSPFKWLQAIDDADLAFVVTNPKYFGIDYEFSIPDETVEALEVTTAEDVLVLNIVNIPNENPTQMTANLLAPIILNQNTLRAMQVVLHDPNFTTRTRLLPDPPSIANPEPQAPTIQHGKG